MNPKQASKVVMLAPTRRGFGEGRSVSGKQPTNAPLAATGVVGAAREEGPIRNVGDPSGCDVAIATRCLAVARRESERLILLSKPGNSGGGKEPHFWVLWKKQRGRRLTWV